MFKIFFPISGLFFDPFLIFSTGLFGGFVSGFLGLGCGVIITPFLMELGIPPLMAVSTQLCHAVGTNLSSFLSYNRKKDVDFQLVLFILMGGILGASCEWITLKFSHSSRVVVNKFAYIYIITLIIFGIIMMIQSIKVFIHRSNSGYNVSVMMRRWMLYIPFHKIFRRSRAEMSCLVPIFVGFLAGLIVASLGGGNNLFMAPIITYLIGRISPVVYGTTSLAGCFITSIVVLVYAESGYYCDFLFVLFLFAGASIGSFIGVRLTYNIKRHYINAISSIVVFIMASRLAFKTFGSSSYQSSQKIMMESPKSKMFEFANGNVILYTILCIIMICVVAISVEKLLQSFSEKRIQNKENRGMKK